MLKLGILISGRGSNMAAILSAIKDGRLNANVAVVLSNNPTAAGLQIARDAGVEAIAVNPKDYPSGAAYEQQLATLLSDHGVDLVVLAGYMKILGKSFIQAFAGRMINIHPSLLPKFKGLNAQQQALEAQETESGCSVHWVTNELDSGEVIDQVRVPILPTDTVETLTDRILIKEHELLPSVIQKLAQAD